MVYGSLKNPVSNMTINRVYIAIGILSMSIISFELTLIQIFSITQWYHFAYMVISIALLGFGVAGTIISIWGKPLLARFSRLFPFLLFLTGGLMTVVVFLTQADLFRFDTFLLFQERSQVYKLLATYLWFFLPFLTGALAIGLTFVKYTRVIGRLYLFNLAGSGLGGLLFISLVWYILPPSLPAAISFLPFIAGLLFWKFMPGRAYRLAIAGLVCVSLYSFIRPAQLSLSQFKSISKSLLLPDSEIMLERNCPQGLTQVVRSPALRYAPGVGLNFKGYIPSREAVFNNGNWFGAVISPQKEDSASWWNYTTQALPYVIRKPNETLILQSQTAELAAQALENGVENIYVVESHPLIESLLSNDLVSQSDSLLFNEKILYHNQDPRTFLHETRDTYDLIILPIVNVFGGASGISAIQEQYLYTKEAFQQMWSRLSPKGMIGVTCWVDYPLRQPLRLLATLVETLDQAGIQNRSSHIIAVKSWGTVTFVLSKNPIDTATVVEVETFCEEKLFDPLLLPGMVKTKKDHYNQWQDTISFEYFFKILSRDRKEFFKSYDFNVEHASDDQPYFSQQVRFKNIDHLVDQLGLVGTVQLELGYWLVLITFFQICTLASIFILIPLSFSSFRKNAFFSVAVYFSGLGLGYMFVEIVLIQQCILYLGNPVYATTASIAILLLSSGAGSYFSSRFGSFTPNLWKWPLTLSVILVVLAFISTPLFRSTISYPEVVKILILCFLYMPLGFLMGMPFPLGLEKLSFHGDKTVAWAWGINGFFSVISTVLATIIAIELGFFWLIIFGSVAYLISTLAIMNNFGVIQADKTLI
jgi:hypothetical protein